MKYRDKQIRRLAARQRLAKGQENWDRSKGRTKPGSMNPRKSASIKVG